MKALEKTVLTVRLEDSSAVITVLNRLRLSTEPNMGWRYFPPGLLLVMPDRELNEELVASIEDLPGVLELKRIPSLKWLVSRENQAANTLVTLPGGVRLGAAAPAVIAGPCSVECESQIVEIAFKVKEAGACALRGGAFKPRTLPYSFGGLEEEGLRHLARAREETGLPIVTEAMDEVQLDLVARYADMIQIGSRNMHNFPFLFKVGSHPAQKAVLLKRGFGATIDELLGAAEYILLGRLAANAKEPGLVLCERGIRSFETATRSTLDIAAIPVLKERTHLPVIADPSHAAGHRRWVSSLSLASVAAGAHGLLVEVHNDPDKAWSDGAQCLDFSGFAKLMRGVRKIASLHLDEINGDAEASRASHPRLFAHA